MILSSLKTIDDSLEILRAKDDSSEVSTIAIPEEVSENSLVFISQKKYLKKLKENNLSFSFFILTTKKFYEENESDLAGYENIILYSDYGLSMNRLSHYFYEQKFNGINFQLDGRQSGKTEIHPDSEIAQNVFIGENVRISQGVKLHPGAVIMSNCHIGEGSEIFPNVTIYPFTKLGKNNIVHSGTIIGADGFGYNFSNGQHLKVYHFGGVEIGDDVEIGSNTSIDMGAFTATTIGEGTKIDNFCQISHNCKIGKHNVFCGRSGMSGSGKTEDFVIFGAGAGAAPNVTLKMGTQVAACSIISENAVWGPKETLAGHPARPLKEYMRTQAKLNLMAKKK